MLLAGESSYALMECNPPVPRLGGRTRGWGGSSGCRSSGLHLPAALKAAVQYTRARPGEAVPIACSEGF